MSLKSKTIFPAGLPNVPVGKHACMRSMLVGRTRKYQSWNLLIPSGRRWMSRFGRKGLPLSYIFGQSFDHLMASTFGYCFAIWWSLLVTASSEPRDGTCLTWFLGLNWSWAIHLCTDEMSLMPTYNGLILIGILF